MLTSPPSDERRWVTVVFADIAGFTALSENLDFEDVRDIADRCSEIMGDEVSRYGGTVLNVMGDAVMAVFGAPTAHDDDPERAVRAALAMVDAIPKKTPPGHNLGLHVGVNTGEVMAGTLGPTGRRDYTVMGDTINTGARLEAAAVRGEVVVGRETYLATRHAIRYVSHEPVSAKGKADKVEAWLALAPLPERLERGATTAPMVGREREIDLLNGVWRRAVGDPRAHLVTLIAPPGLGKTRLAREFTATLSANDALVLPGRSLPYGESTGFGPFAGQVRAAAGITMDMTAAQAAATLAEHVDSLFGANQPDVVSNLLLMMGIGGDDVAPEKNVLFYSARRWLVALARRSPTLLLFEDVHWADATLLELIGSVASRIGEVPLMILCLARPELLQDHPDWGSGQAAYTAVTLEPLSPESARRLSIALLSDQPPDVIERLVDASGGNPLFVEELSATVSEQGHTESHELPTSVKAIIGARLDVLTAPERDLLQNAAVCGVVFWRSAIAALADVGNNDFLLDELQARGLIRREETSALAGDEQFLFKHALIREVAYGRLPRRARKERHGVVARHIELVLGEQRETMASFLAHHFEQAGDAEVAANYYRVAGDRASHAWAKTEAVEMYTNAINLTEDRDPVTQARLQAQRARARNDAGDSANAATDLDAALLHLSGTDRVSALVDRARVAFTAVDAPAMIKYGKLAADAAVEANDPLASARVLNVQASSILAEGKLGEAIETAAKSTDEWPEKDRANNQEYADTLSNLALYRYWRGDYEEGLVAARQAVDAGLPAQALQASAQGTAHLGLLLVGLGRHAEALEWFERSVNLGLEWESIPRFSSRSMNMWAGSVRELMDFGWARELSERGLETARRAAFPPGIHSAEIDLFILDTIEGRLAQAEAALPGLRTAANETKGFHKWLFQIRVADAAANLALAMDKPADALEDAAIAIAKAGELPRKKYQVQASTTLARCLLSTGRRSDAAQTAAQALAGAQKLGHPHSVWRAAAELSKAKAALADDDAAEQAAALAAQVVQRFGGALDKERAATFFRAAEVQALVGTG